MPGLAAPLLALAVGGAATKTILDVSERKEQRAQIAKEEEKQKRLEDELKAREEKEESNAAFAAVRDQARNRQKSQGSASGRKSTMLTTPLGDSSGYGSLGATSGKKTLLGF